MKKRAIISLTDKTGVVEFARGLFDLGYEVVSTGGTWKVIHEAGIPVTQVSDITGFPECLDGRVKTLHPMIHAGVLALRDNPEHVETLQKLSIAPVDVVAVNLYPFKNTILKEGTTLAEAIEKIDIGGPSMLRAAAKNYRFVAVAVDPADYPMILDGLKNGTLDEGKRLKLAYKVFNHTAAYDALIASYLREKTGSDRFPDALTVTFDKVQSMRYGENPHQGAAFYKEILPLKGTLPQAEQLHGKELSYNNIGDTDGALSLLNEFDCPCVVAVKHANPCGVGTADTIFDAYTKAYESDTVSIYGGIVAANREIDKATAAKMAETFLEIIVAPSFSPEALEILTQKKNLRLLKLADCGNGQCGLNMKKVAGGLLVQDSDTELFGGELKCVTKRQPTEAELKAMQFGWRVVKHTKSNAIVLTSDDRTLGVGPGQVNRVTALDLAIRYAGDKAFGSVMASDAYLPFGDSVEAAHDAGVTAVIQPGGSIHDQESIDACDKYGIAMVFTGMRHFWH